MPDDIRLADRTTLRVGGPADRWVTADSDDALVSAVLEADASRTPVLLLGEGSNLVVGDSGHRGTVVEVVSRGIRVDRSPGRVLVAVAAGEPWDDLVALTVEEGWAGLEALSGIPGRAGATPIQNVGAYGQEIAQVVTEVRVLDRTTGRTESMSREQCGFEYRSSVFKRQPGRWVVLGLTLDLQDGGPGSVRYAELARALGVEAGGTADVDAIRSTVLGLRRAKGMVLDPADPDTWSAGSFFTNPVLVDASAFPADCPRYPAPGGVKLSAAWLIEQSGMGRGFGLSPGSPARISGKHSLALTNRGAATAADVMALAAEVQRRVALAFGVDLAIEPVLVGDPASAG